MIPSNEPPGSCIKAPYFILELYVKSMASKINCQSTTTSFITPQRAPIFFSLFLFLGLPVPPFLSSNEIHQTRPFIPPYNTLLPPQSFLPASEHTVSKKLIRVAQTISISIYFYTSWKEGHLHQGIAHVFCGE